MIFCNGCSKSGTHILTSICKTTGLSQLGGTVIKRKPNREFEMAGKSALQRVFKLGHKRFVHSHIAYSLSAELAMMRHRHLFILRNPRDIAVSWMRHRIKQDSSFVESEALLIEFISGGMFGESVPNFYMGFTDWLKAHNIFIVKFEDIIQSDYDFAPMFEYLDITEIPPNIREAMGMGPTYNPKTSNWRDYWTETVEEAWLRSGGQAAESLVKDYYPSNNFEFAIKPEQDAIG